MIDSLPRITGVLGAASTDRVLLKELKDRAAVLLRHLSVELMLVERETFFMFVIKTTTGQQNPVVVANIDAFTIGVTLEGKAENPETGHFLHCTIDELEGCTFRSDPVGLVNLYRWFGRNDVIFGTSSMQVAALAPDFRLDETGAYEFIVAGYLISDRTFYENIDVLAGGKEWRLNYSTLPRGVEKPWRQFPTQVDLTSDQAVEELVQRTRDAARMVASAGHACCDLTGGYDSRGIASMFLKADVPFSTVVNGDTDLADVRIAGGIAEVFQLDHSHNEKSAFQLPHSLEDITRVLYLTDGEIDFTEYYMTSLIQQRTAAKGWVTVNGSGGEVFRGYWWEGEWPHEGVREEINRDYILKRIMLPDLDFSQFSADFTEIKNHFNIVISNALDKGGEGANNGRKIDALYLHLRMGRWLARYYSSTIKILPCYSPFLFSPVLDIALRVESKTKKRIQFYRRWLQKNHHQLANIPLENGAPAIPCSVSTVWRFWRFPAYLFGKVINKIQRKTISPVGQVAPLTQSFLRIAFDQKNVALFSETSCLVKSLLDSATFEKLSKSTMENAVKIMPSGQFTRIITLELTLREVSRLRDILKAGK